MADLLGEVDANIVPSRSYARKAIKSDTRRKVRVLSPPLTGDASRKPRALPSRRVEEVKELIDTPPATSAFDEQDYGFGDDDAPMSDPLPSSPIAKAVERKAKSNVKEEEEEDDIMDIAQAVGN